MPAPTGINSTRLYGRFRVFRGDVCREIGCSKMLAICCIQSFERSFVGLWCGNFIGALSDFDGVFFGTKSINRDNFRTNPNPSL